MNKTTLKLFLFWISLLTLIMLMGLSCTTEHVKHKHKKLDANEFKIRDSVKGEYYCYVIVKNISLSNDAYYYFYSDVQVTSFSNVTWNTSTVYPVDASKVEGAKNIEIEEEELPAEMQSEINANEDEFDVTETDDEAGNSNSESESSSESGGDSDGDGGGD